MVNNVAVNFEPVDGASKPPSSVTFEGVAVLFFQIVGIEFSGVAATFEQSVEENSTNDFLNIVFLQDVRSPDVGNVVTFEQLVVDNG